MIGALRFMTVLGSESMEEKVMMLEDTKKAFDCCVSLPPKCDDCPCKDYCGNLMWMGREKIKRSVKYWLSRASDE